ncbi:MAG: restriction endonuclease subunit S [Syntrophobacteraceae bacterium]|jgi:type I restriction enzyme S subunit
MAVKPGYKQTEVGIIPVNWNAVSVGTIASFTSGSGISVASLRGESSDTPVPVFGGNGIAGFTDWPLVREPTVVVGRVGQKCGEVYLTSGPAWITDNALYPRTKHREFDVRFLALALNGAGLNDVKNRNDLPLVTQAILHAVRIAWPPDIKEQEAIAKASSDIDALIGSLDRLIAKKRDLKRATMQHLLTGKIRLPGFSGEWETKRLGEIADLHRRNVVPAASPDVMFMHFSLPAFDEGQRAVIEPGVAIGSNKFQVPQDAVLVSKLNPRIPRVWAPESIGPTAIASTEFLVLTPTDKISRSFLFVICSSPKFCEQMELSATGTTGSHQRISPGKALRIQIWLPTNSKEQTAISIILADMDAELAALEQRRDKTRALKQAMMQELLTGRTRLV